MVVGEWGGLEGVVVVDGDGDRVDMGRSFAVAEMVFSAGG